MSEEDKCFLSRNFNIEEFTEEMKLLRQYFPYRHTFTGKWCKDCNAYHIPPENYRGLY